MQPELILLSRSPQRKVLLQEAGFRVLEAKGNPEPDPQPQEEAIPYALRAAEAKWRNIPNGEEALVPLLSADTVVAVDDCILGKPQDDPQARKMLKLLAGRIHQVHTAVALGLPGGAPEVAVSSATVRFAPLSEAEIDLLCKGADAFAGGYAIQGKAGQFVTLIDGELDTVIGLPLKLVQHMYASVVHKQETAL